VDACPLSISSIDLRALSSFHAKWSTCFARTAPTATTGDAVHTLSRILHMLARSSHQRPTQETVPSASKIFRRASDTGDDIYAKRCFICRRMTIFHGMAVRVSETTKIYIESKVTCNILNLVDEILPFLTYVLGSVDKTCGGWSVLKRSVQCM